ncbi:hypothetical protein DXG01_013022 [Tephrocybe rancida]|nr:hypothetical protein DXG01_013022 [Tephrocybe rancida]
MSACRYLDNQITRTPTTVTRHHCEDKVPFQTHPKEWDIEMCMRGWEAKQSRRGSLGQIQSENLNKTGCRISDRLNNTAQKIPQLLAVPSGSKSRACHSKTDDHDGRISTTTTEFGSKKPHCGKVLPTLIRVLPNDLILRNVPTFKFSVKIQKEVSSWKKQGPVMIKFGIEGTGRFQDYLSYKVDFGGAWCPRPRPANNTLRNVDKLISREITQHFSRLQIDKTPSVEIRSNRKPNVLCLGECVEVVIGLRVVQPSHAKQRSWVKHILD